jgi:hypothetical protein
LLPSQDPAHALPSLAQAARAPWGGPWTAEQVPSRPFTSHASHWPVHALSQQKPSTQSPDLHWSGAVQAPPLSSFDWQLVPAQ